MKRIISACLEQTDRFETEEEYEAFISVMKRKNISFKVIDVQKQSDNTVIAKIKKQYNNYDVGNYLD